MGRRSSASERLTQQLHLEIKAPSLFRCPISLEVMRSPVSLVTGVTYDRQSIQRWLDSGNKTCPATMLPLPTTDLVPNLTLRRLINLWSSGNKQNCDFEKLAAFFANMDVDDAVKNGVVNAGDFIGGVVSAVANRDGGEELNSEMLEAAIEVVSVMLNSDWIDEENKDKLISALCCAQDQVIASLIVVFRHRHGNKLKSRIDSAIILKVILSGKSNNLSPEALEAVIPELILLISSNDSSVVNESLGCLMELLPSKQAVKSMVQSKLVPTMVNILSAKSPAISSKVFEWAMEMLEAAANCATGRKAIGEMVEECVEAVMGRLMKVGKRGREAAVKLLWGVCYGSWVGPKGKEAVAAATGGMAKLLVVMQGDCSPAVRRMAGDLLRVFRVNAKSLVAGYDTKTTHIMPF